MQPDSHSLGEVERKATEIEFIVPLNLFVIGEKYTCRNLKIKIEISVTYTEQMVTIISFCIIRKDA